MIEIVWDQEDDFITGVSDGDEGIYEGQITAGGHDDSAIGLDGGMVLEQEFSLKRIEKFGDAVDWFVAVVPSVRHKILDPIGHNGGWGVVHYSLAQRERSGVLSDPFRHDGDYGSLDGLDSLGGFWVLGDHL